MNLRKAFSLPPGLSPLLRTNFIYLFWDIAWWGFYIGSTAAFLAIYAARCGATPGQIGLLAAIPALTALLLSLPTGRWLRRFPAGKATVWSAFASRSLFLVYALLPWLFPPDWQVQALLVLAVFITLPTTVINISFSQFFVEAIPIEWRSMVVGTRMAIMSLISFLVTLLCGLILARMPFPTGYQVVFLIGFLGAILTVPVLRRVHPIEISSALQIPTATPLTRLPLLPVIDDAGRQFIKVVLLLFFFNMTNNMVAPLVPDLLVNKLQFPDSLISLATAVSTLLIFLVSLVISRSTMRVERRQFTGIGAVLLAVQAVLLALAQDASGYMIAVVVGGLASGILASSQYNYHLHALPPTERPSWLSWSLLLGSAAILAGSLMGPALARFSSIPQALIVLGGARLVVGFVIWMKG
jgi:MFS family permease